MPERLSAGGLDPERPVGRDRSDPPGADGASAASPHPNPLPEGEGIKGCFSPSPEGKRPGVRSFVLPSPPEGEGSGMRGEELRAGDKSWRARQGGCQRFADRQGGTCSAAGNRCPRWNAKRTAWTGRRKADVRNRRARAVTRALTLNPSPSGGEGSSPSSLLFSP